MNIYQIKELINDGWKIASHSVTHRDLTKLSKKEIEKELINSKKWIKDNLKVKYQGNINSLLQYIKDNFLGCIYNVGFDIAILFEDIKTIKI